MEIHGSNDVRVVDFSQLTDEEVIAIYQKSESSRAMNYLLDKYRPLVRAKARSFFLAGGDQEDVVQEGMIGLYKSIRDFDIERNISFRGFVDICVERHLITAIKTASRQKHIPLNTYVSIHKPVYDSDSERTLLEVLPAFQSQDPEDLIICQEEYYEAERRLQEILTDLEWNVLMCYLDGFSYQEISLTLSMQLKSVDNALQRVKKKVLRFIAENRDTIDLPTICKGLISLKRNNDYLMQSLKYA